MKNESLVNSSTFSNKLLYLIDPFYSLSLGKSPILSTANAAPPALVSKVTVRPDLSQIDPELLSYITKEEFGNLAVSEKTKMAIANVMKYR